MSETPVTFLAVILLALLPPLCMVAGLAMGFRLARLQAPVPSASNFRPSPPHGEPEEPKKPREDDDDDMKCPEFFTRTNGTRVAATPDAPIPVGAGSDPLGNAVKEWSSR